MGAPPATQARTFISNASGQVTIGFLSLGNDADDRVEIMVELGIIMNSQGIGCAFDDLVGVGVVKRKITLVLSLDESGCQGEIVETTIHLTLMEGRRNRHGTVDFNTWRPETVIQVYLSERHLLNGSRGSRLFDGTRRKATGRQPRTG